MWAVEDPAVVGGVRGCMGVYRFLPPHDLFAPPSRVYDSFLLYGGVRGGKGGKKVNYSYTKYIFFLKSGKLQNNLISI